MKSVGLFFLIQIFLMQSWAAEQYESFEAFLTQKYPEYVESNAAAYKTACGGECVFEDEAGDKYYFQSPIQDRIHEDLNWDGTKDYVAVLAKPVEKIGKDGVFKEHTLVVLKAHHLNGPYTLATVNTTFLNERAYPGKEEGALYSKTSVTYDDSENAFYLTENRWEIQHEANPSGGTTYISSIMPDKVVVSRVESSSNHGVFMSGDVVDFFKSRFRSFYVDRSYDDNYFVETFCKSSKGKILGSKFPLVSDLGTLFLGELKDYYQQKVEVEDGKACSISDAWFENL